MKRVFVIGAALLASCSNDIRPYANNDLQLATSYSAKEACSCLFVMEQTEAYCRNWTKASPAVASFRVDWEEKTVESGALLMWGRRARYIDERRGCVLE